MRDDLSTYDPYDIWKTRPGLRVKQFYYRYPRAGMIPAGAFTLFDHFMNHRARWFYRPQEYPIVRSMAALCLLNLYKKTGDPLLLPKAVQHLRWLLANSCQGYAGYCWGLGFTNVVSDQISYPADMPLSTMTPYALEAFVTFTELTHDSRFHSVIESILAFFNTNVLAMEEDGDILATSYGPFRDRTVTNAVSYAMYSYCLCLPYVGRFERDGLESKIRKLYAYVRRQQRPDGSWFYSPYGRSFIDGFHSCIVLKNIIKSNRLMHLSGSDSIVAAGYEYLKRELFDKSQVLFRRFSIRNKPGLVRFDMYDNAEALNLALLLRDEQMAGALLDSVVKHFCRGTDVYSQIDVIGSLRRKNTLRWAVMPFLYAASQMV
jgi:hypothetical protein